MQCRARRRRKNQHLRPLPSSLDVSLLIWNHTIVETTQACCSIPSKSSSFVPLFHKFRYSYLRERELLWSYLRDILWKLWPWMFFIFMLLRNIFFLKLLLLLWWFFFHYAAKTWPLQDWLTYRATIVESNQPCREGKKASHIPFVMPQVHWFWDLTFVRSTREIWMDAATLGSS